MNDYNGFGQIELWEKLRKELSDDQFLALRVLAGKLERDAWDDGYHIGYASALEGGV